MTTKKKKKKKKKKMFWNYLSVAVLPQFHLEMYVLILMDKFPLEPPRAS